MNVRVVHVRHERHDLYIGRAMPRFGLAGSPLGNPYKAGRDADPIGQFRRHFYARTDLQLYARAACEQHCANRPDVPFALGCWCAPAPCHGDVIKAYLDSIFGDDDGR